MNTTSCLCTFTCLVSLLALPACGGPLSHTVKLSQVDESKRSFTSEREAHQKARAAYDDAKSATRNAKRPIKEAEHLVKEKKGELKIAEEQVDVEKAKRSADQNANVGGSKTRRESAQRNLAVAKAKLSLAENKRKHLQQVEEERKAEWLHALAVYEAAKAAQVSSNDPKWREKKAKVDSQLKDKDKDLKSEKNDTAKSSKRVKKYEDKLVDAQE